MSPLLDPTHPARVRDPFLVERLTRDAPSMLVKRFPGDVVDPNSLAPNGGLLVLSGVNLSARAGVAGARRRCESAPPPPRTDGQ